MKLQGSDILPYGKCHTLQKTPKVVLLVTLALVLLTIIPLYYPLLGYPLFLLKNISSSSSSSSSSSPSSSSSSPFSSQPSSSHVNTPLEDDPIRVEEPTVKKCDIFTGEWIRNPKAPYYINTTCWAIHEHQNCMKYGRPDLDFMKWRWKPDGCELPIFNPAQFLELMRDKTLAFVGDSVARNHMQSLMCLLSRVVYPIDVSYTTDENFKRWRYTDYNFTMASFWTPFLIKTKLADPGGPTQTGLFNLYLDELDDAWTNQMEEFDYLIISAGQWFYRPTMFYENSRVSGCYYCLQENVTDLTVYYGYRKAFRTVFKAINSNKNFKGMTILRTFSPSHFENGLWNKGGNCVRTRPFMSNETTMEGPNLELYMTQIEEYRAAERVGLKRGLKFRLLDTTQAMWLRPDGHPSRYGHWPNANVTLYNDCVHWCLPGPIDSWSDFLLEMLKMEGTRKYEEKLHSKVKRMKAQ